MKAKGVEKSMDQFEKSNTRRRKIYSEEPNLNRNHTKAFEESRIYATTMNAMVFFIYIIREPIQDCRLIQYQTIQYIHLINCVDNSG